MKYYMLKSIPVTFLTLLLTNSCKKDKKADEAAVSGINLAYMDPSISPKDNFFKYVNGKWLDATEIPADQTVWGSFNELRKQTDNDALAVLNEALNNPNLDPKSDQAKAVYLYQTIMDTVSRNKMGVAPLKPYLDKIAAVKNIQDLQQLIIEMEPKGGIGFYGFGVRADAKNSNRNIGYLGAGDLGLPRDYYVDMDSDTKEKREKYKAYITRMLQFLGDAETDARKAAERILAFETRMATPRMTKEERRDPEKRYNPRTLADLQKLVPVVDWKNYFQAIGAVGVDTVIVGELKYFETLQTILKENRLEDWKNYLRWTALNSAATMLSDEIEKTQWEFYSKELAGAQSQKPRDERALDAINRSVGEALGKLYVEKKFPPEAKAKAEKMIANVVDAYENRIHRLDWMTEDTKKKAIEKLRALTIKIAYPDVWKDYSKLEVKTIADGGSYFENMLNIAAWNYNRDIEKLGKPVDKTEWFMAPQIVNAYFNPPYNEIVFPAAILQPPFYNYLADDPINYGGIGAVIGHEISHSFDDSGAKYDKDGNLNNWWTDDDKKKFEERGQKLADQYSAIEVLDSVFINGKFTLGENIGDLGGVNAAYDALQLSFKQNGRTETIDGFTPEQRFFISWATVWRTKMRDEALRNRIKTDPHSPGMYRATQPLRNIDAFYTAFEIKETDKMYIAPKDRVQIW